MKTITISIEDHDLINALEEYLFIKISNDERLDNFIAQVQDNVNQNALFLRAVREVLVGDDYDE